MGLFNFLKSFRKPKPKLLGLTFGVYFTLSVALTKQVKKRTTLDSRGFDFNSHLLNEIIANGGLAMLLNSGIKENIDTSLGTAGDFPQDINLLLIGHLDQGTYSNTKGEYNRVKYFCLTPNGVVVGAGEFYDQIYVECLPLLAKKVVDSIKVDNLGVIGLNRAAGTTFHEGSFSIAEMFKENL